MTNFIRAIRVINFIRAIGVVGVVRVNFLIITVEMLTKAMVANFRLNNDRITIGWEIEIHEPP